MAAVWGGFVLFVFVSGAALWLGVVAQRNVRSSLHQSLHGHSSYVRYMQDKHDLNKMGYPQQLLRRFNGFAAFAVPFSGMSVLAGAMLLLMPALAQGGPWLIGFAWPVMGLFAILTACAYASQASAYPVSGGAYHYTAATGGRRLGIAAGLLQFAGSVLLHAFTNMWLALWIQHMLAWAFGLQTGRWGLLAIIGALYVLQTLYQLRAGSRLSAHFAMTAWVQVAAVMAVIVLLSFLRWGGYLPASVLYEAEHPFQLSGSFSWHSSVIGLLLLARMYLGAEHASPLAEETRDPRIQIPWAVYLSAVYVFIFGYIFFAYLFLHYPIAPSGLADWQIVMEEIAAAAEGMRIWWIQPLLLVLIAWSGWSSGLSAMTASSRIWFGMCRDGVIPWAKQGKQVSERWRVPQWAVMTAGTLSLLCAIVCFGFFPRGANLQAAAVQILALAVIGLSASGLLSIGARCYARIRRVPLTHGPWQLGRLGQAADYAALCWLCAMIVCAGSVLGLIAWAILAAGMAWIGCYSIWKHRSLRRREYVKTQRSNRLRRHQLDEFIRVEQKFPQL